MPTYEVIKTITLSATFDADSPEAALRWVKGCDDDLTGEESWDDRHEETEVRQVYFGTARKPASHHAAEEPDGGALPLPVAYYPLPAPDVETEGPTDG